METFQKDSNTLSINEVDSEFSPPTHMNTTNDVTK